MNQLNELNDNYDNDKLKTIVVSKKNYDKLKELGFTDFLFNPRTSMTLRSVQTLVNIFQSLFH